MGFYGKVTQKEKSLRASKCGAVFPCVGTHVPDYQQLCPIGWTEGWGHECLASSNYSGPCVGRKKFKNMNIVEKSIWANSCGVSWPMRNSHQIMVQTDKLHAKGGMLNSDCVADYKAHCPNRWSFLLSENICKAPTDYSGRCAFFVASAKFTARQKQAFAEACNAAWPCTNDAIL